MRNQKKKKKKKKKKNSTEHNRSTRPTKFPRGSRYHVKQLDIETLT